VSGERGFITKGTPEYFAEREKRIQSNIDEAKSRIDEIEAKVRAEIVEIGAERDRLRHHLDGFIGARNKLAEHRNKTVDLVAQLQAVISICDTQLPVLDAMLDELEHDSVAADARLENTEQSRHRQLHKHERKKTRYELRKTRLGLRKKLFGVEAVVETRGIDAETVAEATEEVRKSIDGDSDRTVYTESTP
jgi:chromosome segregation ATPase